MRDRIDRRLLKCLECYPEGLLAPFLGLPCLGGTILSIVRRNRSQPSGSVSIFSVLGFLEGLAMIDPNESSSEDFAEAVGEAIIAWQRVEVQCAFLFAHLIWAYGGGAVAVFYYIKNFSTRIEMMNIAARLMFYTRPNKRLNKKWLTLSDRLSKASSLRNRIAHSEIDETMTPTGWKFTMKSPSLDWSQLDPHNPDKWNQRRLSREVTYSQIDAASRDFYKLADDLSKFAVQIIKWRDPKIELPPEPTFSPSPASSLDLLAPIKRRKPPPEKKTKPKSPSPPRSSRE